TPANLHATGATATTVGLAWSASSDDVGVAGYTVYRGGVSVGSTGATSFAVAGLACGTSYSFAVDAFDAAGDRSGQAGLSASTPARPDALPISTPANLHATGATATTVGLAWSASSDDVGVAGYTVYRGGVSVGSTGATSFAVAGLACGTSYSFAVDAF